MIYIFYSFFKLINNCFYLMSINGIDKVESKNKKTKIIKIPLHYQNSNNENPNLHMSLNKYFQNNQISKLKIGFNHNLKKEIKTLKTSSCLEKTTETPFQNKINEDTQCPRRKINYTFLRRHYPYQVKGSKFIISSQPVNTSSPVFIYDYITCRCGLSRKNNACTEIKC